MSRGLDQPIVLFYAKARRNQKTVKDVPGQNVKYVAGLDTFSAGASENPKCAATVESPLSNNERRGTRGLT